MNNEKIPTITVPEEWVLTADDEQDDERPENQYDICAFDESVDVVYQCGDKGDVDNVDDVDRRET